MIKSVPLKEKYKFLCITAFLTICLLAAAACIISLNYRITYRLYENTGRLLCGEIKEFISENGNSGFDAEESGINGQYSEFIALLNTFRPVCGSIKNIYLLGFTNKNIISFTEEKKEHAEWHKSCSLSGMKERILSFSDPLTINCSCEKEKNGMMTVLVPWIKSEDSGVIYICADFYIADGLRRTVKDSAAACIPVFFIYLAALGVILYRYKQEKNFNAADSIHIAALLAEHLDAAYYCDADSGKIIVIKQPPYADWLLSHCKKYSSLNRQFALYLKPEFRKEYLDSFAPETVIRFLDGGADRAPSMTVQDTKGRWSKVKIIRDPQYSAKNRKFILSFENADKKILHEEELKLSNQKTGVIEAMAMAFTQVFFVNITQDKVLNVIDNSQPNEQHHYFPNIKFSEEINARRNYTENLISDKSESFTIENLTAHFSKSDEPYRHNFTRIMNDGSRRCLQLEMIKIKKAPKSDIILFGAVRSIDGGNQMEFANSGLRNMKTREIECRQKLENLFFMAAEVDLNTMNVTYFKLPPGLKDKTPLSDAAVYLAQNYAGKQEYKEFINFFAEQEISRCLNKKKQISRIFRKNDSDMEKWSLWRLVPESDNCSSVFICGQDITPDKIS